MKQTLSLFTKSFLSFRVFLILIGDYKHASPWKDQGLLLAYNPKVLNFHENLKIYFCISLSTVVLNSRDRQGNLWLP